MSRPVPSSNPFKPGEVPPKSVVWLHPLELLRTAYHTLISRVLTGYLDRRELQAALPRPPQRTETKSPAFGQPAALVVKEPFLALNEHLVEADDVWLDFVADIGDSWDATYATLSLVARRNLHVHGLTTGLSDPDKDPGPPPRPEPPANPFPRGLPRADILVLGGDLVYPTPSRNAYRTRTRTAFEAALPEQPQDAPIPPTGGQLHGRPDAGANTPLVRRPSFLAIPGNHDWYDGLTGFLREFCQGGRLGGWRLEQSRSYFAVELTNNWWLLGIDIALDSRIDSPQQRYFIDALEQMRGRTSQAPARIILCTAKPVWLDSHRHSSEARRNLAFFLDLIEDYGCQVKVILSGDIHHYSRYEAAGETPRDLEALAEGAVGGKKSADDANGHEKTAARKTIGGPQLIVSGGGGAYLSATHQNPARVSKITMRAGSRAGSIFVACGQPYPSVMRSKRLAWGVLGLAFRARNWPFLVFAGIVYALMTLRLHPHVATLMTGGPSGFSARLARALHAPLHWSEATLVVLILGGLAAFTYATNHGSRWLKVLWGAAHGVAHIAIALWLVAWFNHLKVDERLERLSSVSDVSLLAVTVLGVKVSWLTALVLDVVVGGMLATTLLGLFLLVSDRLFGWHTNEVFTFQSIFDYRNFIRMRLSRNGTLTLYPIGLGQVPRQWRARAVVVEGRPRQMADSGTAPPSRFEPGDAVLSPHSIEPPIEIV